MSTTGAAKRWREDALLSGAAVTDSARYAEACPKSLEIQTDSLTDRSRPYARHACRISTQTRHDESRAGLDAGVAGMTKAP
ncbi:hypothetical protein A5625_20670 [Mycobacterium sp. 1465703.0]|nr:hypothetical protein A5625_20670 [Mycobacterium sp. 1465703.0]